MACVTSARVCTEANKHPPFPRPRARPPKISPVDDVGVGVSEHGEHGSQQPRVLVFDSRTNPVDDDIQLLLRTQAPQLSSLFGWGPNGQKKCRKRGKGGAVDERVRTGRGEFNPPPPNSGVRHACAGCRIRNGKGRQGWSYPEPQLTETGTWASVALDNQDLTSLAICSVRSTSCEHRKFGQTHTYWSTMQARCQGCQDPETGTPRKSKAF